MADFTDTTDEQVARVFSTLKKRKFDFIKWKENWYK